jgi:hypothetical protein
MRDRDLGVFAREALGLAFGFDFVAHETRARVPLEVVLLGQEVRIERVGAIDDGRAPQNELADARFAACVEHMHGADVLEFVSPGGVVRGRRQERGMDEGLDLLAGEDGGDFGVRRRQRQIDLVELGFGQRKRRLANVDGDDLVVAPVLLESLDELGTDERIGARDRDDALLWVVTPPAI